MTVAQCQQYWGSRITTSMLCAGAAGASSCQVRLHQKTWGHLILSGAHPQERHGRRGGKRNELPCCNAPSRTNSFTSEHTGTPMCLCQVISPWKDLLQSIAPFRNPSLFVCRLTYRPKEYRLNGVLIDSGLRGRGTIKAALWDCRGELSSAGYQWDS